MIVFNVFSIFILVLLGFVSAKIGWTPLESGKYFSNAVIYIAAPCAIIHSMSEQILSHETAMSIAIISALFFGLMMLSWIISILFTKISKSNPRDSGIYRNMIMFQNNGFMGMPVSHTLYGMNGLFLMVCATINVSFYMYTIGVWNVLRGNPKGGKFSAKHLINVPIVTCIIGLIIFLFQIPIPSLIDRSIVLLANMMTPLCMMFIGIQLTASSVGSLIKNFRLLIATVIKLLILPAITVLIFIPFKDTFDPSIISVMILNGGLPSAAIMVAIAEMYKGNATLASEGVFLTTLFSIGTIPLLAALTNLLFPIL